MGIGKNNPFAGNGLGNIAFSPDGTGSTNLGGSGESQQTGGVPGRGRRSPAGEGPEHRRPKETLWAGRSGRRATFAPAAMKDPWRWSERRADPRLIARLPPSVAGGGTPRYGGAIRIFRKLPSRSRTVGMGFWAGFCDLLISTLPPCAHGLPGRLAVLLALPPPQGATGAASPHKPVLAALSASCARASAGDLSNRE